MYALTPVLIVGIIFFTISVVISLLIYYRSRERQMLIEKNLDPSQIKDFYQRKKINSTIWLKLGIISIAFGIGLAVGNILYEIYPNSEYLIAFGIFIFTGIGSIISYFVSKKYDD